MFADAISKQKVLPKSTIILAFGSIRFCRIRTNPCATPHKLTAKFRRRFTAFDDFTSRTPSVRLALSHWKRVTVEQIYAIIFHNSVSCWFDSIGLWRSPAFNADHAVYTIQAVRHCSCKAVNWTPQQRNKIFNHLPIEPPIYIITPTTFLFHQKLHWNYVEPRIRSLSTNHDCEVQQPAIKLHNWWRTYRGAMSVVCPFNIRCNHYNV